MEVDTVKKLLLIKIISIEEKIDEEGSGSLELEDQMSAHETALIHLNENKLNDKDRAIEVLCPSPRY